MKTDFIGNKIWRNKKGEYHREDGPAIEYLDGDKEWYINGKLHRLDGPASIEFDGDKEWCKNGLYHRLDGPAVERAVERDFCHNRWYIEGHEYSEEEYNKIISTY